MSAFSPLFIVGASLFMVGGLVALGILASVGGMAYGMKALTNLQAFVKDPQRAGRRRVFYGALGTAGVGALLCFGGIAAGDAERNRPCAAACEAAGHAEGRCRASPHQRYEAGDPYACWCREREQQWAPTPVALEGAPCAKR